MEKQKNEVDFTSQNVADYQNDIEATNTPKIMKTGTNERPTDRREKTKEKKIVRQSSHTTNSKETYVYCFRRIYLCMFFFVLFS